MSRPVSSAREPLGQMTVFKTHRPRVLGKTYSLDPAGNLIKGTAGAMIDGEFKTIEFRTAEDVKDILAAVGTDEAVCASVCTMETTGRVVTKAALARTPGAVVRSGDYFTFPPQRGIIVLDYDPPANAPARSREELWQLLVDICPAIAEAAALWWCSGSSFIFNRDIELQGLRGQRIYLLVEDISDTKRFGEVLAKRFWLRGFGRVVISESGRRNLRTVFDDAMFAPAHLDFIGGAVCESPLTQRRGSPTVLSSGGWLDTRAALPDLTPDDEARCEALIQNAKLQAQPEADRQQERWRADRIGTAVSKLITAGIPMQHAHERAGRMLSAALHGTLLGDFELTLDDGTNIRVADALAKPSLYNGRRTLDPLEPEYQNGKVVGKLFLTGAAPTLFSFAHGGETFLLRQQPRRLNLQPGRKAELATEILNLLSDEPDVFLYGGRLVQVGAHQVRRLGKSALMHLIGSRFALCKTTEKGFELPADVPADVAEMVLALAEG